VEGLLTYRRFFGPLGLFQYGAASFVYELMPSGRDDYVPTLANTASLFVNPSHSTTLPSY
jgi:hypothetical protein